MKEYCRKSCGFCAGILNFVGSLRYYLQQKLLHRKLLNRHLLVFKWLFLKTTLIGIQMTKTRLTLHLGTKYSCLDPLQKKFRFQMISFGDSSWQLILRNIVFMWILWIFSEQFFTEYVEATAYPWAYLKHSRASTKKFFLRK